MKEPDAKDTIAKATRRTGPLSAGELEALTKSMLQNLSDPKVAEQVEAAEVECDRRTIEEAGKRLSRLKQPPSNLPTGALAEKGLLCRRDGKGERQDQPLGRTTRHAIDGVD